MRRLLIFAALAASAVTHAQNPKPEAPAWFEGQFTIGTRLAGAKETVTVWAVRTASDMTKCGTTQIEDGGRYSMAVIDRPECANVGNGGKTVTFVFGWNGEQVGLKQVPVDPKTRGQWNQTYPLNLVQSPASPLERPQTDTLVFRRFYGQLISGSRPVGPGVQVSLRMIKPNGGASNCGDVKTGADGFYILDVLVDARCESRQRTRYEFTSNGRLVGEFEGMLEPDAYLVGTAVAQSLSVK